MEVVNVGLPTLAGTPVPDPADHAGTNGSAPTTKMFPAAPIAVAPIALVPLP